MIKVWIMENDLDYYYANGFPSKYWTEPQKNCLELNITLEEFKKWQQKGPKPIQEKNWGGKQLLND